MIPKPAKKIKWDDKLWRAFSLYIRLRDAKKTTGSFEFCRCVTCQITKPFADIDAGHCFSRSKLGTKYDVHNVHGQCRKCNGNRHSLGEMNAHKLAIVIMYGQGELDRLTYMSKKMIQLRDAEMETLYNHYTTETKKLRGEL